MLKDLITFLAEQLVSDPSAVQVTETQSESTSVVALRVAKQDLGRVIGKQGRTVKSMRTILTAVASREHRTAVLEIIEQ